MAGVGIIGGTGLSAIEGLGSAREFKARTPFGSPSSPLVAGELAGREVFFLARHGRGHRIAPHEINHRANIWALRSCGVRFVISVAAVGSLREELAPGHAVLPDQFFDRMSGRERHTFFGGGIVAHVGFAEATSPGLRTLLAAACERAGVPVHNGGTYVCMDGPAFSTRAESNAYRALGFDLIGMTNLPEAKLCREAEMAFATLAMITDYDCWKEDAEPVSTAAILDRIGANAEAAKDVLAGAIPGIPREADWPEHRALEGAIATPKDFWPPDTASNLGLLLDRFMR